ncbi:MAG TPA: glycosyltransferase [Blastocatellia bacterium]|nr:glycosyltransferase [Blastocatellia bacterium]
MNHPRLSIVILGPAMTSSWSDENAATYRGLTRELVARGHDVLYLARDRSIRPDRDGAAGPRSGRVEHYSGLAELRDRFTIVVRAADLVIVGSSLPEGIEVGEWVTKLAAGATAFYDFKTPTRLAQLRRGTGEDLSGRLIPRYHLYLSLTGGPALEELETDFGSPMARPLYGSVDPELYYPEPTEIKWDLGYRGGGDEGLVRLEAMLSQPAFRRQRMRVAGLRDFQSNAWPSSVQWETRMEPAEYRGFYNAQRFMLNFTRPDLSAAKCSPSARLFEAAACSTPVISDWWPGMENFFKPGEEILIAHTPGEVLTYLRELPEPERRMIGERAWVRVLTRHTAMHRAFELETYALSLLHQESCVTVH